MPTSPFALATEYLEGTTTKTWLARLSSVGSGLCAVALLPLVFLFVDLIASGGRASSYASLPVAKQLAFHDEWKQDWRGNPEIVAKLERLKVPPLPDQPTTNDWEIRRSIAVHTYLESRIGTEAAEAYFPLQKLTNGATDTVLTEELGLLATVIRERERWTGRVLATVAAYAPWMWKPAGGYSANGSYLATLALIASAITLLRGVLLNISSYCASSAVLAAGTKLRRAVYNHSQRLSAVATKPQEQKLVGTLVSDRVDQIQTGLRAALGPALRGPIMGLFLVILLLLVNTWLTIALLSTTAIAWLVAGQAAAWFRREARWNERKAAARLAAMRESFATMQLSKAYMMERFSQTRFERLLAEHAKAVWKQQQGETFSRPTLYTVVLLVGIALLFLAGRVVLAGEMSLAGLSLKAVTIALLGVALQRWLTARADIQKATDAAAEVFAFLDRRGDNLQNVNAEFLQPPTKSIDFHEVALREAGTGRMIFEKVTFQVPVGQKVAIYADDPDAQKQIALLLTKFTEPTAGEVRIDGKSTRWLTMESIRAQVALILESSLIFSDTVAVNIGCGEPSFTLPQIIEAAKIAHVHQFVQRLPTGYETLIGENGVSLSTGKAFRIALARAILRDPAILVIEEPSEVLDADSLMLIDDTLARIRPGRTIIILAKRPQTADHVERVIHIQNGRVSSIKELATV